MIKRKTNDTKKHITLTLYASDFIWAASILAVFVVTLELFYRMIVDYNGKYESDVRFYVIENVKSGMEHDRLLNIIFQSFYDINQGTLEANVYMAAVIATIVIVNYIMIRYYLKSDGMLDRVPRSSIQLLSVLMLFIGPIYVPVVHEWFYRKSFSSFAWHSPTQQSMTLFAMIAALCFMKMYDEYQTYGVKPGWWIATMISTFIATGFKPSYTISLSVAVVVMFAIDLLRGGRDQFSVRLRHLFVMGCSIIPSGLYLIWMHTKEFVEDTQFGEEHKVIIGLSHVFSYEHLFAAIICGITFPIIVFAFDHSLLKKNTYRFTLYIFIMGVLQWALFTETGTRGNFGNFVWGRIFGCYLITVAACAAALKMIYSEDRSPRLRNVFGVAAGAVLICSVASQLYYFMLILTGHGYLH